MQQNTTETSSMEQGTAKMDTKKKVLFICVAVLTVLAMIYMGFSIYFTKHFHIGTTINHVNVSGASVEDAKKRIQQAMKEYRLTLVSRDGSEDVILGDSIDLQVVWQDQVDTFMEEQDGFVWIKKLFEETALETEVEMSYDVEKLKDEINKLSCMSEEKQVAATDAMMSEFSLEYGYQLIPAIPGTQINTTVFQEKIENALHALGTELHLAEEDCYVPPVVDDDNEELINKITKLNKVLGTVITYQIGSETEILDASVFSSWVSSDENGEIVFDEEAMKEYVKSLASKYNTYYTKKTFMTSYGKEVVIKNSQYGWKVDNTAEREAIMAELLAGEAVTRDLHYSMKGNTRDGNDYGNTYVEINLTAQHLFMYVDGKLILESDFVSGDLSEGWGSPTGAFALTYKERNATLRGATYTTPVSYWMPFAGNVGMHDATWRDEFGASIYKRDGSHGCINLPKEKAKIIFENIKKGFPVLCYELEGTQSKEGIAQDQAYKVMDAIKAIGTVSLNSEAKIQKARTQYEALSDLAKTYVSNYKKLVSAEKTLAELKAAQIGNE